MENRLKNVKNSRLPKKLIFSDEMRQNIYKKIEKENESDEYIKLAILQILSTKQTGFQLLTSLLNRGIKKFVDEEGTLYLLLHELENKQYIASEWLEDEKKYYVIKRKGKKVMHQLEQKSEFAIGELTYEQ